MLRFLFSINPSMPLIWELAYEVFFYLKLNKLDKKFNSLVKNFEEEMEEDEDMSISVAFMDDKAYWVVDNTFYQADVINGIVDRESSRPVDVSSMSYRDMSKMLFILDNLNEG